MMLLRRERLRAHRSDAAAADFAVINSRKWRCGPRFKCSFVFRAIFVHEKMRVFIVGHRPLLARKSPLPETQMTQARQVAEWALGSFENNAKPRRKRKQFSRDNVGHRQHLRCSRADRPPALATALMTALP